MVLFLTGRSLAAAADAGDAAGRGRRRAAVGAAREALERVLRGAVGLRRAVRLAGAAMALLVFVFAAANVLVFGAEFASEWSRLPPPAVETRELVARGQCADTAPCRRVASEVGSSGGCDSSSRAPRPSPWRCPAAAATTWKRATGSSSARDEVEQRIDARERSSRSGASGSASASARCSASSSKAFPQAQRTSPTVRSRGRNEPTTIDAFLTDLLRDIDGYWTTTFEAAGLPEPRVRYLWVAPGGYALSGCGAPADDRAAFYCPADDTIYVAQRFAADLYEGVLRGLPGESAGLRARGGRLRGRLRARPRVRAQPPARAGRLRQPGHARRPSRSSCRPTASAGTWANSVYEQGLLQPGDLQEATDAALAVGDFDVGNAQHHGTPEERRDALLAGFRSGEPSACATSRADENFRFRSVSADQ